MARRFIYHTTTRNISFLQTAKDLKILGIKNCMFFLKLYDEGLKDIYPYDPNLSDEMAMRIINECIINPWYFLREVCKIPEDGNTLGTHYILNRGNLASTFCFLNSIDQYLVLPRQIGKTQSIIASIDWTFLFGTTNSQFAMANKKLEDANNNLARLKAQRELLPKFLQLKMAFDEDGNTLKETDNVRTLRNRMNNNMIVTKPSANSEEAAEGIGRGNTQSVQYFDELEFTAHIKTIIEASGPAYNTASTNARKNGAATARAFSSTPGDLDSPATIEAMQIIEQTCKWTEKFYDMKIDEINKYIETNSGNGIVYIEYDYKQLGKDETWFKQICKTVLNNPLKIRREILLQRIRGNNLSPFEQEDLESICEKKGRVIEEIFINKMFKVDIYEKLDRTEPYIVSVDCSTGNGCDNNAITILNPYTLKVDGEFKSPYISTTTFKNLLIVLIRKYIPRGVLVIERNHVGEAVIDMLRHSEIRQNLYYDKSKDLLGEGIDDKLDDMGTLKLEAAKRKLYGVATTTKSRQVMMSILENHVIEHKDKFVGNNIIEDLLKLVRTKNGKIEAGRGFHDDSVMSYLIGLYVYYHGNNLARFGIIKGAMHTKNVNKGLHDDVNDEAYAEALKQLEGFTPVKTMEDYQQNIMREIQNARNEMRHVDTLLNTNISVTDESEFIDTGFGSIDLNIFDELNDF